MFKIKSSSISLLVPLFLQSTPGNSNPLWLEPLAKSKQFSFPSDHFLYNFTLKNSNFFLFPLKVRIIGSWLYLQTEK